MIRLISWNVNGIRAAIRKGFMDFATTCDADVICLQEVRANPDQVDLSVPGYETIWNPAERKGYSGTAILTRVKPVSQSLGLGIEEFDTEGRVLTVEYDKYYLVTAYVPNAQRELTRLEYRCRWDAEFLAYVDKLQQKKPVVFCGDLNVAHQEIDLANPKSNKGNAGFTDEERQGFTNFLDGGFVDIFRELNPDAVGQYSWWSNRAGVRERNVGWRLDYFLISEKLRKNVQTAAIQPEVMGSDHCPVELVLELK